MPAPSVAVITDSTSYLPPGWAAEHGVDVVPVQVIVAGQPYDETDDDQAQQVADALRDWQPVTTSRPSPARFLDSYRRAADAGAQAIVVATLSSAMSATYESALLAANECTIPVEVVDTRSIAMGEGFAVISGAVAAQAGADREAVARVIRERAAVTRVFFYVDTLEYLRRGGRVSTARAAVGQALQVKPLLQVVDGRVEKLDQVRTSAKAMTRLAELAVEAAAAFPSVEIAVQHLGAADRAASVAATLRARMPGTVVVVSNVGGVVGAHVGPGMVAVIVAPVVATASATSGTSVP
jgi:DegV family protein with EDD domain